MTDALPVAFATFPIGSCLSLTALSLAGRVELWHGGLS
jgi:hypothetical protein